MKFQIKRVNVIAYDGGYIELFGAERGPTIFNRFDENQKNLAGGFSFVNYNGAVECSAFKYAKERSLPTSKRHFGVGYYENEIVLFGFLKINHLVKKKKRCFLYLNFEK